MQASLTPKINKSSVTCLQNSVENSVCLSNLFIWRFTFIFLVKLLIWVETILGSNLSSLIFKCTSSVSVVAFGGLASRLYTLEFLVFSIVVRPYTPPNWHSNDLIFSFILISSKVAHFDDLDFPIVVYPRASQTFSTLFENFLYEIGYHHFS